MTVFCKRFCSEYDHSKHLRGHNNPFCGYGNRSFSHRTHTSLTTKMNLVAIIIARVSADVTSVATENNVVWLPIRHRCRKTDYLLSQNALSGHGLAQRLRIFGVLSFRSNNNNHICGLPLSPRIVFFKAGNTSIKILGGYQKML